MEESEKRKERLKAMRMQATQTESSDSPEALPGISSLANPFTETPGLHQEQSQATPRFDYYTDPMAAFSSNRRNNPVNQTQYSHPIPNSYPHSRAPMPPFSGPQNVETIPSPQAYQWRGSNSPNQMMYKPRGPPNFAPYQSPSMIRHEGVPPQGWNAPDFHHQYNNIPGRGFSPNPGFQQLGPPSFAPRHSSPHWRGNIPRPTSPNFGRGRSQSGHSGRSGGRGQGFHGRGFGLGRPSGPEQFFHQSMLDDPWKDIVAVIWTPVGSHWMPQSVRSKKQKTTDSSNKFGGGNLAEFLAATFKEASNETDTTQVS